MNTQNAAIVECEESVYSYQPADNGAGPLWCYGATCIVRHGQDLFVSGLETLPDIRPETLNNVRWLLYRRGTGGWALQQASEGRTREPCPLAILPGGRLYLSDNPTLLPPNTPRPTPARPQVLAFAAGAPGAPFRSLLPEWQGAPAFTEHSYRGFAADAARGELLLMNILGHDCYHWSLLDGDERWAAQGTLAFPWGADYETPQPIRICYPEIVLRDRAVHFLGISDIVEPVSAWKQARFEVTGRAWDYDFRRLFYTATPDVTAEPFGAWVEVASRESTSGTLRNLDLWLDEAGDAHILWLEQSCDPRIRPRFFADVPLTVALEYAIVRRGAVCERRTLFQGGEGLGERVPTWGRFHVAPGGRLFAVYSTARFAPAEGNPQEVANHLVEILPGGSLSTAVGLALEEPLAGPFMTATPRAGVVPSATLDLLGHGREPHVLRYVRVRAG